MKPKILILSLIGLTTFLYLTTVVLAYNGGAYPSYDPTPGIGTIMGGFFVFFVGIFVLNIILLVWVAKDAKRRGMDNPILWMLLVFFAGLVGLIIYFLVRPKGRMVKCEYCGNKKLEYLKTCPQCGR